MECRKTAHLKRCNCTYEPCSRKGVCCDCLEYHLRSQELPACFFSTEAERTYDRSVDHYLRLQKRGGR